MPQQFCDVAQLYLPDVRSYTRNFARKMLEIMPNVISSSVQPAAQLGSRDAIATEFRQLWQKDAGLGDTWEDASLRELCSYLLGAKGLMVPPDWEWIIPSHL